MIYKTNNIYAIKIAKVTKIEPSGLYTHGSTHYEVIPEIKFARKIGDKFSLISNGLKIYNNHNNTRAIGDMFILWCESFNILTKDHFGKFITKNKLLSYENIFHHFKNKQTVTPAKKQEENEKCTNI